MNEIQALELVGLLSMPVPAVMDVQARPRVYMRLIYSSGLHSIDISKRLINLKIVATDVQTQEKQEVD